MKERFFFLTFLIIISISAICQNQVDSTQLITILDGNKFMKNGQLLAPQAMLNVMKDNREAYAYMLSAQENNSIAMLLGYAGGFMIGWTFGTFLGGGKPNMAIGGIGAGLILIAIPVSSSATKNLNIAVDKYNQKIRGISYRPKNDLRLGMGSNGFSISLRF